MPLLELIGCRTGGVFKSANNSFEVDVVVDDVVEEEEEEEEEVK